MPTALLEYFLYPASPWAWLGNAEIERLARTYSLEVRVRPVDLPGSISPATGGLPLAQRPAVRQAYRLVELERWAAIREQPINLHPKFFPVAAHDASRLIILTQQQHGAAAAVRISGAIMAAVWQHEQNIADPATLTTLANQADLPGDSLMADLASAEPTYRANTEEALQRGVFGVPWYFLNNEPFWGQDRLELLERALQRATREPS